MSNSVEVPPYGLTPKILLPVNDHPAKSGVSTHQTVCEWTGQIAAGELSVIEPCIQLCQAISSELALPFLGSTP